MKESAIKDLMGLTIEKIRNMADVSTVIGDPIQANGFTVIPISTVSYGFGCGGSDFPSKSNKELFGGGGAAGVTITPIAFLVVSEEGVKVIHIDTSDNMPEKVINSLPNLVDKVTEVVGKFKKKKEETGEEDLGKQE